MNLIFIEIDPTSVGSASSQKILDIMRKLEDIEIPAKRYDEEREVSGRFY